MSLPLPPVLVVDDEKNMRLSVRTLLEDEGYTVRTIESVPRGGSPAAETSDARR